MAISSSCADNIVLIGFMGSGKSTVGRELARRTGRFFLDADLLIEGAAGKKVREIFEREGEAYFRELERRSVRWMAECVRGSVISTGGGMPTVVDRLHDVGTVIYLDLPFEKILDRIDPHERAKRPLFSDLEKAQRLFDARKKIYEAQAQLTVAADRPAEAVVEAILRAVGE